jgi:hypothetical protein
MSLRSLRSGTIKKLRNGKALVTAPEAPTVTAVSITDTVKPTITFTPAPLGVVPTSFTVTSSPGSFTATGNSSPITYNSMGIPTGDDYTFSVTGTAATGTGIASAASTLLELDATYVLFETFTSSGTFTVPAGATKLAVFALGGGGGGTNGANNAGNASASNYEFTASYNAAGSGGASSYLGGFKDETVSGGQTFAVSIGAGGNAGSAGGTTNFGNLLAVTTSAVNGNATTRNSTASAGGGAGGSGGNFTQRFACGQTNTDNRGAGSVNNTAITLSQTLTGLGATAYNGANGGGGGGSSRFNSNLGAGYGGGDTENGGTATGYGQGGGGGGYRQYSQQQANPTFGGGGFNGVVYVYCGN